MSNTIEMSAGWMAALPQRVMRLGVAESLYNSQYRAGLLQHGDQSYGWPSAGMRLMKGSVPTDFSTLTNLNARSSDILVEWLGVNNDFTPSQTNVNPVVVATTYQNAVGTGTATWLWWYVHNTYQYDAPETIWHQIVATVGPQGSGLDLEMDGVNITAGQPYRVLNLRMLYPSSWTY